MYILLLLAAAAAAAVCMLQSSKPDVVEHGIDDDKSVLLFLCKCWAQQFKSFWSYFNLRSLAGVGPVEL